MEISYQKNYKNDLYIMIPYTASNNHVEINEANDDEISQEFKNDLKDYFETYCNNKICNELQTYFICKESLACFSFDYDNRVVDNENFYMFLTEHKATGLFILTLLNLKTCFSPSAIQDQVSSNKIFINKNNKLTNIDDFMKNVYCLERCGDAKTLVSMSSKPEDKLEFNCMLANESYKPFNNDYYFINSSEIAEYAKDNIAQYKYYELYASKFAILYILSTFSDDDIANIQDEITILFIIELIMFQSASVLRTNNKIVDQLSKNEDVSLHFIENLYKEFGKTSRFWNQDVFKYETIQNISDKLNNAFETEKILDDYKQKQNFLEHIVSLRDIQNSNKESKLLNIVVLILTLIQVIPIIIQFKNWLFDKSHSFDFSVLINFSIILVIVAVILIGRNSKKKKRKL